MAFQRCTSGHLSEFITGSTWFGKTPEYSLAGFSGSVKFAWLSTSGQIQCPSGHASGLVECWSLLMGSQVEVGKCGRKTSTVVSDDTA